MSWSIGVVVIGRNEGARLRRCLASVQGAGGPVIYVDSASSDASVDVARAHAAHVVELDPDEPLCAARARNAGKNALQELYPECTFVCFVDGDCELAQGWIEAASDFLTSHERVAAVAGRRRERSPNSSIWNRLCDLEWNTPIGPATATGGDFVVRLSAFHEVGGFDESFIAGEEPEFGLRLRRAGWEIERLDHEMTLHDADMTRFTQWWRRSHRAGQAFLHGFLVHRSGPENFWRREALRPLFWTLLLPGLILALLAAGTTWGFALALLYPLQAARTARREQRKGRAPRDAAIYGIACLIGHFAELSGQVSFLLTRLAGRAPALVEYKGPAAGH